MPVLPSYKNQSVDLLCKSIDWFFGQRLWHRRFPEYSAKFLRTPFHRTRPVAASKMATFDRNGFTFKKDMHLHTGIFNKSS